ncbi:hypothetical protein PR202_ga13902 [Eleusine coracana subsp. coracana]|uniref:RRM domain-containing protein n=1 Tax=Eleusine coracana subsp. coracana TaxID=191504 RepID=A0AAV5CF73_ELECO|nr:hypothetical protein PR202_ga13902 [Eleusine coracana subsp. coracana]
MPPSVDKIVQDINNNAQMWCLAGAKGLPIEGWTIVVSGVKEDAEEIDLHDVFSEFGHVKDLHYNLERRTGYAKGYALIEYESFEEAQRAIREMNGTQLLTKTVYVDWAFSRGPIQNLMSTRYAVLLSTTTIVIVVPACGGLSVLLSTTTIVIVPACGGLSTASSTQGSADYDNDEVPQLQQQESKALSLAAALMMNAKLWRRLLSATMMKQGQRQEKQGLTLTERRR